MSDQKPVKKSKGKKILVAFLAVALMAGIAATVVYLLFFRGTKPAAQNSADKNFKTISEKFTDVRITDEASALQAVKAGALIMGLEDAADELSIKSVDETDGLSYYRFQQNYKGYPVFGKAFVLVAKGEEAASLSANCFELGKVDLDTNISDEDAEASIKKQLTKMTGVSDFEYFESEKLSDDKLWIYALEDNSARLAYEISTLTDYGFYVSFVDAITGEILYCGDATNGVQQFFRYSGQKEQHTFQAKAGDEYNEMCYESDTGTQIIVHSPSEENRYDWRWQCDRGETNIDIVTWRKDADSDQDADAVPDPSAVDALYHITKAYNYYKDTFGKDFFSDASEEKKEINIYIHINGHWVYEDESTHKAETKKEKEDNLEADFDNAMFARTRGTSGAPLICIGKHYKRNSSGEIVFNSQGDPIQTTDFGSELDIMAHEYTHGVVSYTCGLNDTFFNHMPSAINEAIADIMGNCIEAHVKGKKIDWVIYVPDIGYRTSIKDDPDHENFQDQAYHVRDYHEPDYNKLLKKIDQKEFLGKKREEHYASTIISYAAYLMSVEGGGKLSDEETARLWYHTLLMLPSDCTFNELAKHVVLAAHQLDFAASKVDCIATAFRAVGIEVESGEPTYGLDVDLQVVDSAYQPHDDYTIEITGSYQSGWPIKREHEYNKTIKVKESGIQSLKFDHEGEYVITVHDNKDKSRKHSISFSVKKGSFAKEMYLFTDFGKETAFNVETDAKVDEITREAQFTKYLEDVLIPEKGIADQTQSYVKRSEMVAGEYTVYSYQYDSASDSIVRERKNVSLQSRDLTAEQMREEAKAYEELISSYSYAGIISVDLHDYDGDGELEMLVLTGFDVIGEYGWKGYGCNAEFYDVNEEGNVELCEIFNVSLFEGGDEMNAPYEIGREDVEGYDHGFIVARTYDVFDISNLMETTLLSSNATLKKTLKYYSLADDYSIMEWDSENIEKEGSLIDSGSGDWEKQAENYESLLKEKGYVNDTLVKLCELKYGMLDYTGFAKKYCFGLD